MRGRFALLERSGAIDSLDPHLRHACATKAERIGSARGHIENAAADKGAAIIHSHSNAALIGEIGDAQHRAKGQAAMRGGQCSGLKFGPARRAGAV